MGLHHTPKRCISLYTIEPCTGLPYIYHMCNKYIIALLYTSIIVRSTIDYLIEQIFGEIQERPSLYEEWKWRGNKVCNYKALKILSWPLISISNRASEEAEGYQIG